MQIADTLAALDRTEFATITIHKAAEGYQANLRREGENGWRIRIEDTPGAALAALLDFDDWKDTTAAPAILPPPPY